MLILSRKPGQSIIIGGIIEITVTEVRGDQVRIGVTAPRDVPVFRREVLEGRNRESLPAAPDPEEMHERLRAAANGATPDPPAEEARPSSDQKRRSPSLLKKSES